MLIKQLFVTITTLPIVWSSVASGQSETGRVIVSRNAAARRFAVVAPEKFHPALHDFVEHKKQQLPTVLVSLEHVLKEQSGADDPERLKRYLYKTWKDQNIRYALLVGDADVFPVRYMVLDRKTPAAFDYAFYPSDLYYSDLVKSDGSFDDWNARKESFHSGYFGEVRGEKNKADPINYDQVDYRPDIMVGRWPVSTPEEVRIVAGKSLAYEKQLAGGKKPGMRTIALFSVGGWVDSRHVMDDIAEKYAPLWKVEKRYYADKRRNDKTPPPDKNQLHALLNSGVGMAFHAGHGTDNRWERCFSVKGLNQIRNADRLPIMISAGCSTARLATLPPYEAYMDVDGNEHTGTNNGEVFKSPPRPPAPYQRGNHNPTGLGEQLLRQGPNGAVAYIGCNTGSQPCALTLLEGFANSVGKNQETRLGDCWAAAISYYYDKQRLARLVPTNHWYPPSIFFQGMKFMLFGDPTLRLPSPNSVR